MNERPGTKYWNSIFGTQDSNWSINVEVDEEGRPVASPRDTSHYLYVYDTFRHWLRAASFPDASVLLCELKVRESSDDHKEALASAIGELILEAADRNDQPGTETMNSCMKITLAAFTLTQSFELLKRMKPEPRCRHMIYILYRMRDKSLVGRPVALGSETMGTMEPDAVLGVILGAVATDTDGQSRTQVARMIERSGGAMLNPELERALSARR